ncbi:MAG: GNAT family N-acetyltransferase [Sphingobacteriales bacterium]|nr:GNAT family N-acetyltransferase [Sphingobacteriales bacterium]
MLDNKKYKIKKLTSKYKYKEVTLTKKDSFDLTYSSCIDKESVIIQKKSKLFVECKNGQVQVFPTYCKKDEIHIGGLSIDLLIKEITDDAELNSYRALANFHYKEKALFGRTSILVAINRTPYLPKVIGYIELATPFYVNKPRAEVLNAPFHHNGINWKSWDIETTKKYINTIVRIARCVVYPEFRGVGLGQILIQHAEEFAKERWQISNIKPLFLEISADMLKYVPFAEKAGMHYIGETQGNLNRIHADLGYLLTNYRRVKSKEIVSNKQMGIVEQQKSRLRKAMKLAKQADITIEEFILRLKQLQEKKTLKDFAFFQGLVSLPKPTYLKGLDATADLFLKKQLKYLKNDENSFYKLIGVERINAPITIKNLSISYHSKIRKTHTAQAVYNAFSISPTDMQSPVIHNLSFDVQPSEIVFITGSSGSGKTSLLNFLSAAAAPKYRESNNSILSFPGNRKIGIFKEIFSNKPLVELFGQYDVNFALQLMGTVGLSDAYVYLKKYEELSKGQQFRAQLASALLTQSNILIIDEFCSNLDPVTANVISYRLSHLARKVGLTVIVAGAHCDNFIHSLRPDKVLRLSTAWDYEIIPGEEFMNSYPKKKHLLKLQTFAFKDEYLSKFINGGKQTTIRKGKPKIDLGFTVFESSKRYITGYVKEITEKRVCDLTEQDALKDGFGSLSQLKAALKRIYKDLNRNSIVTIYSLSLLDFL